MKGGIHSVNQLCYSCFYIVNDLFDWCNEEDYADFIKFERRIVKPEIQKTKLCLEKIEEVIKSVSTPDPYTPESNLHFEMGRIVMNMDILSENDIGCDRFQKVARWQGL